MQTGMQKTLASISSRPAFCNRGARKPVSKRIRAELSIAAIPSQQSSSPRSSEEKIPDVTASIQEATAIAQPPVPDGSMGIDEYEQLKQRLLHRAKQGSGFLALYIFLQQGLVATGCALLGSLTGYIYLQRLMASVDGYTGQTEVPLVSARQVQGQPFRALSIVFAVYRQAITARLLVPLGLGGGIALFNSTQPQHFTLFQEFDILLGFLFSYKSGMISAIYDTVKPKASFDRDERPIRPIVAALPDFDEERKERLLQEKRRN